MKYIICVVKGKMICWSVGGWICLNYPSPIKLSKASNRVFELKPFKIDRLEVEDGKIVARDNTGTVLMEWDKEDVVEYK